MQLEQWLHQHIGLEHFTPGLGRLQPYLQKLKNQLQAQGTKIVSIAGTNGKGEVAWRLAKRLEQKKISYCLWTSPHLVSVTERFISCGREV